MSEIEDDIKQNLDSEAAENEAVISVDAPEASDSCEGLPISELESDTIGVCDGNEINGDETTDDEEVVDEEASDEEDDDEEDDDFELSGSDGFEMPLPQVIEAILFAADEAVSIEKIAKAAGKRVRRDAVAEAISELQTVYQESDRAFEIVEIAEKFQMLTRAEFASNVQALYGKKAIKEEKDKKITPVALDTLAIIAYKQPVTRAEVEAVRGVGCGQVMRQLMERGSIKPVGKKMDVIGYPLLYGTTEQFLQEFGLASLDVLPMAAELRRLTKVEMPKPEVVEGEDQSEEIESKLEGAVVIEGSVEPVSSVENIEGADSEDIDDREDA